MDPNPRRQLEKTITRSIDQFEKHTVIASRLQGGVAIQR
jgi:hypothetical protein